MSDKRLWQADWEWPSLDLTDSLSQLIVIGYIRSCQKLLTESSYLLHDDKNEFLEINNLCLVYYYSNSECFVVESMGIVRIDSLNAADQYQDGHTFGQHQSRNSMDAHFNINDVSMDSVSFPMNNTQHITLSSNKRNVQIKLVNNEHKIHGFVDIYLHKRYIYKWKFRVNTFYGMHIGIGSAQHWEHQITLSSFGRLRGCYLNSGFIKGDIVEMVLDCTDVNYVKLGFIVNNSSMQSQKIKKTEMRDNESVYKMKIVCRRGDIHLMDYKCLYRSITHKKDIKSNGTHSIALSAASVPVNYTCFKCLAIGKHWIAHCKNVT